MCWGIIQRERLEELKLDLDGKIKAEQCSASDVVSDPLAAVAKSWRKQAKREESAEGADLLVSWHVKIDRGIPHFIAQLNSRVLLQMVDISKWRL